MPINVLLHANSRIRLLEKEDLPSKNMMEIAVVIKYISNNTPEFQKKCHFVSICECE